MKIGQRDDSYRGKKEASKSVRKSQKECTDVDLNKDQIFVES